MIYDFFRWIAIITAWPIQFLLYKKKIFYEDKKARSKRIKGGALIISNHYNFFDYPLNLFTVLPRKLNVVASEMPYSNRAVAHGMKYFGGIKADRVSKSMAFIDKAAKVIRSGQLVQIYPEGRNTPDGSIQPFTTSYIMIALRANAPIIPIVTDGNYGIFKRTYIKIGKRIDISELCPSKNPTREEIVEINAHIHKKVCEMRKELEAERKRR